MGYHLFFVNHTKKQIVDSKRTGSGLEIASVLGCYLAYCKGDTIEVMGEEAGFIETHIFNMRATSEYKYINLYLYHTDDEGYLIESEDDRLRDFIHSS